MDLLAEAIRPAAVARADTAVAPLTTP